MLHAQRAQICMRTSCAHIALGCGPLSAMATVQDDKRKRKENMKKVEFVLSLLFIVDAVADSTPTSVGYVDNVIGGLQMKLMLVRGEWNHNYALAPGENVFLPNEN